MLQSSIEMTLHTNDANMLFTGKWLKKKHSQFVPSFHYTSVRLNRLLGMAQSQNPYAEAALIDVDYQIDEMTQLIRNVKTISRRCIKRKEKAGIKTKLLEREDPYIKTITSVSEYTLCLASMFTELDAAFRYLRTAHLCGSLSTEATKDYISALRRKSRMINNTIVSYANRIRPGVKRSHIIDNSEIAKTMIKKLGVPSEAIMNREITFRENRVMDLALE